MAKDARSCVVVYVDRAGRQRQTGGWLSQVPHIIARQHGAGMTGIRWRKPTETGWRHVADPAADKKGTT